MGVLPFKWIVSTNYSIQAISVLVHHVTYAIKQRVVYIGRHSTFFLNKEFDSLRWKHVWSAFGWRGAFISNLKITVIIHSKVEISSLPWWYVVVVPTFFPFSPIPKQLDFTLTHLFTPHYLPTIPPTRRKQKTKRPIVLSLCVAPNFSNAILLSQFIQTVPIHSLSHIRGICILGNFPCINVQFEHCMPEGAENYSYMMVQILEP